MRGGLGDRNIVCEQRQGTHQPAAGLGREGIPSRHDQAAQLTVAWAAQRCCKRCWTCSGRCGSVARVPLNMETGDWIFTAPLKPN